MVKMSNLLPEEFSDMISEFQNHEKNKMKLKKPKKINTGSKEKVKELARRCLQFKWIYAQEKNLNRLISPCAFCQDVYFHHKTCKNCLCPIQLCGDDGKEGLIGALIAQYGNIFLSNLPKSEYEKVLRILIELEQTGCYLGK